MKEKSENGNKNDDSVIQYWAIEDALLLMHHLEGHQEDLKVPVPEDPK